MTTYQSSTLETVQAELDRCEWERDPFAAADADGEATWPYALAALVTTLAACVAALGCAGAL